LKRSRSKQKGFRGMASLSTTSLLQKTPSLLARLRTLLRNLTIRRRDRSLRIAETVSLGDKRFVAILEFERQRFLIGITSQSVSLLQALGAQQSAPTVPAACASHHENACENSGDPS
jgi:flagellar biogenesis protein FliO